MSDRAHELETRAVISVYDKAGIVDFTRGLQKILPDMRIISTGNTARALLESGIEVMTVEDVTGFPEILGGRVKTLQPAIHGGILANLEVSSHIEDLKTHRISPIDIVVVDLYPFSETVAKKGVTRADAIEQIDIGGVTLIRAAAKNADRVTIIFDPKDYSPVLQELQDRNGTLSFETRAKLAMRAFDFTSQYDGAIAQYLEALEGKRFPDHLRLHGERHGELRYGENPQQSAVVYTLDTGDPLAFFRFDVVAGKQMSFNNWLDHTAAVNALSYLGGEMPACVIVKHTNPCGGAYGSTIEEAFEKAWDGDALAAFGGIVVVNRPIDAQLALRITNGKFIEIIAAPEVTPEALKIFQKKPDIRILINQALINPSPPTDRNIKAIRGGLLMQETDIIKIDPTAWEVLSKMAPRENQIPDLLLAWQLCRTSKSNTITLVRGGMLVGSGVGQQDRKRCCELAVGKAIDGKTGEQRAEGAVAASDAFFPYPDGPKVLIQAGVKAIIQPAGSKRDKETIDVCNQYGVAMVTTGLDKDGNRIRGFNH